MNRNALARKRKKCRKLMAKKKARKVAVRRVLRQKANQTMYENAYTSGIGL
jgi:hypothetical protein